MAVESLPVAQNTTLAQSDPNLMGPAGDGGSAALSESLRQSWRAAKTTTGRVPVESAERAKREARKLAANAAAGRGVTTAEVEQLDRRAYELQQAAAHLEHKAKMAENIANILGDLPGGDTAETKALQQSLREASVNMKEDAKSIRQDVEEIREQICAALEMAVRQRNLIKKQNNLNAERALKTREKEKEEAAIENEEIREQQRLDAMFTDRRRASSQESQGRLEQRLHQGAALVDHANVRRCRAEVPIATGCDSISRSKL
ncbi:hypothetical protein FKG94_22640 [Exilibacterium tricleocarpae]|uniref:Uncharacterized protein n=1 Tax=Exilibacterium tricleocarpae TaxID=2591008 RepID=A0A545SYB7_9GAMM|nr:hypothetical protein [Exilibacterium tricleocarpae]TQV69953.1 hypothetical protein FKG94_22640 [Exilibacterium tricleocarpae]